MMDNSKLFSVFGGVMGGPLGGMVGNAFGGVLGGLQQNTLWQQQQLGLQQQSLASLLGSLAGAAQFPRMQQVSRREAFTVSEAEEQWMLTPGVETFDEWLDGMEWRPVA
jgi:hypothetical protein